MADYIPVETAIEVVEYALSNNMDYQKMLQWTPATRVCGRLIDADELKELFRETITGIATRTDMKGAYEHMIRASAMVIEMIDDAPTVIEG